MQSKCKATHQSHKIEIHICFSHIPTIRTDIETFSERFWIQTSFPSILPDVNIIPCVSIIENPASSEFTTV